MSASLKLVIGVAIVALVLVGVFLVRGDGAAQTTAPAPTAAAPHAVAPPPVAGRSQPAPSADAGSARTTATDAAVAADPPRVPAAAPEGVWSAVGSVLAAEGSAPVAGARVDVSLRKADGEHEPLGRTTAAADGSYALAIDRVERLGGSERIAARVVAHVEAPGFQPIEVAVPLANAVARRVTIPVRLTAGAAVRGRAVDRAGKPAAGATVALSIADGRSGPGGLTLVSEGRSDGDGRFALGFAAAGKLHLSARADAIGTHALVVEVEARRDRDVGDVVLDGGAPLAGVARHADDTPATQLELWALEGELAYKPDGFETAVRRAREIEIDDDGLSWSRAFTDAQGRFEFRGLRPQHYALKAGDPSIVIEPRQGRWEPGQKSIELQVLTPLLSVRVVDAAGAPLTGALVEITDLGIDTDGSYTPGGQRRAVARGAAASASFSADPETPMAVRARHQGLVSTEEIVYFGQGTLHVEKTLTLAPRAKAGSLRFTVNGADASKVSVRAALASPATSTVDEDVGVLDADARGVVSGVPSGEHQLVVDFAGESGAWFFPWRTRTPVRVEPDRETAVSIDPVLGSRLALRCELVGPPPAGYDAVPSPSARRETYGARFVLVPAEGGAERSLDLKLGEHDVYLLVPGETAEARDLLPSGDAVIRVEGAAWISTQTPIRLVPGRRLAATIELKRR